MAQFVAHIADLEEARARKGNILMESSGIGEEAQSCDVALLPCLIYGTAS